MSLVIRPAEPADAVVIHGFLRGLAEHQNYAASFKSTPADIERELFGEAPHTYGDMALLDGAAVGVALWHYVFSSFTGRSGLYIDDLYVIDAARSRGVGQALLAELARRCADEGLCRLEWAVRTDNDRAIAFYRSLGAGPIEEWRVFRLDGRALASLSRITST